MAGPRQVIAWDYRILFVFGSLVLTLSSGAHFRGGTISWKPVGGNQVEFFFKLGWTYNNGPGCNASSNGMFMSQSNQWKCVQGCSSTQTMATTGYYCKGANQAEDWEQGENHFNYTFPNAGQFVVEYSGGAWMKLDGGKGNGNWAIRTSVDLRTRSDTVRPNSSPVSLNQPLYYLQMNCHHELRIPVLDPDNDTVRCRWATGKECDSVCNALPGATLNETSCIITMDTIAANSYNPGGYYAVAITIEDFPPNSITLDGTTRKTSSDSLSSVPIQFLIQTPSSSAPCAQKPRFVSPTPAEASTIVVQAGDTLTIQMVADNSNDKTSKITAMYINGPVGLQGSNLMIYPGVKNTFYKTLTWHTATQNVGQHIVCSYASNDRGKTSDSRCFTIKILPHPCQSQPCQHGGACQVIGFGVFNCSCLAGYTGMLCEINIDDCLPGLCQNGATCVDKVNDYYCVCVPGYTDKNCSTDIDDCSSDPCENGGTCSDLVNDYSCLCLPGFTDKNCSTNIDDCSPDPCQNNATCIDLINDYSCVCVSGYTDKNCSTDIDDCSPDPCQNNATCIDLVNDYSCVCLPGYTDKNCSTDIDECGPAPCQNGATCLDQVNGYSCICVSGFLDTNCSTAGVDFCHPDPCANDGVCHNGNANYTCLCVDGWQGLDCKYKPSPPYASKLQGRQCVTSQNGGGARHGTKSCCQATGYSDCRCHISSYDLPEAEDVMRDLLDAFIGFPVGLALSLLTYWLYSGCCACRCCTGHSISYRDKHPSRSRTQSWDNKSASPTEVHQTWRKTYPRSRARSASSHSLLSKVHPTDSEHARASAMPMNIYRASFNDDTLPGIAPKKHPNTYSSGSRDWNI